MVDRFEGDSEVENWLPLGQAANRLGVHPTTLRRWADKGDIPFFLTPGGHRRFAVSDLDAFAEMHRRRRSLVPVEAGLGGKGHEPHPPCTLPRRWPKLGCSIWRMTTGRGTGS